jgi:hypothetical protein
MNKLLIRIVAGAVGAVVGFLAVSALFHGQHAKSLDQNLRQVATDLNKKLPMMVDDQTRLDQVSAKTGTLIYAYSLPNATKNDLDFSSLAKILKPQMIANYRDNKTMTALRQWNVSLDYQYKDKNGDFMGEILVTPDDLK